MCPRMVLGPLYLTGNKNSGGQREEGHWVIHHVQGEHHQSYLLFR